MEMVRLFNRLFPTAIRRHKVLGFACLFTVIAAVLQLAHQKTAAHDVLGAGSLILAIPLIRTMWDDFNTGAYGVNIIAIVALITAVIIREFWTAMAIVFAISLTRTVEQWAQNRTLRFPRTWLKRTAVVAHIVHGKKVSDIAPGKVHINDRLIINPGEIVPVESIIIAGSGSFDESPVALGRSVVEKNVGDSILAGSINTDGIITVKATRTAAKSIIGEVSRYVRSSSNRQAPLMRLTDRLTIPFTLVTFALAVIMWVISGSPHRFLQVLTVATPLPLIAIVPLAFNHGIARGLQHGIVVRTDSTLERIAKLKTLAFNMIGVLTLGKPVLVSYTAFDGYSKDDILAHAAALGIAVSKQIAQPIIQEASRRKLKIPKARLAHDVFGQGIAATVSGKKILLGTSVLLDKYSIKPPVKPPKIKTGQHVWFLSIAGEVAGAFILEDAIRPESAPAMTALRKLGLEQFILFTGSNAAAAKGVAETLDIGEAYSELTNARKLAIISSEKYKPVGYVSNGVEDAPILTSADVGFIQAVEERTNTFDSADVLLLGPDSSLVAHSIAIAKGTLKIAWQSIIIGIGLSLIAMAVFAVVKIQPLYGVLIAFCINMISILSALRSTREKLS